MHAAKKALKHRRKHQKARQTTQVLKNLHERAVCLRKRARLVLPNRFQHVFKCALYLRKRAIRTS